MFVVADRISVPGQAVSLRVLLSVNYVESLIGVALLVGKLNGRGW